MTSLFLLPNLPNGHGHAIVLKWNFQPKVAHQRLLHVLGGSYAASLLLPIAKREQRLACAHQDPLYFFQTYLPEYCKAPFAPFHRDMAALGEVMNTPTLTVAPRGTAKSTILTFNDLLRKICFQRRRFLVVGAFNETAAIEFTNKIKQELESNLRIRQDFGDLTGRFKWQAKDFVTSTGIRVLAIGSNQSLRGKMHFDTRPDDFSGDDLESNASARSATQTRYLLQWLFNAVYPAMRLPVDGGCSMKLIGTMITRQSVLSQLFYSDDRPLVKRHFGIVDPETGKSIWPEWIPDEEIQRIKKQVGLHAFMAEYMNQPLAADTQIFREEWLRHTADISSITDWERTVAACDPSATQHGDYKAIIVSSLRESDHKAYVRHAWIRKATVEEMLAKIAELQGIYDCDVWIEDNAIKDFLDEAIRAFEQRHRRHLRTRPVYHSQKKELRIEALQSPFERGVLILPEKQHSDTEILVEQLLTYPTGAHDDGPDALAEAYRKVMQRIAMEVTTTGEQRVMPHLAPLDFRGYV